MKWFTVLIYLYILWYQDLGNEEDGEMATKIKTHVKRLRDTVNCMYLGALVDEKDTALLDVFAHETEIRMNNVLKCQLSVELHSSTL